MVKGVRARAKNKSSKEKLKNELRLTKRKLNITQKKLRIANKLAKQASNYEKKFKAIKMSNKILKYQKHFKYCPKNIYEKYDLSQGTSIKSIATQTYKTSETDNKIKDLIDHIGNKEKKKTKTVWNNHVTDIINVHIGEKMLKNQFFDGAEKSINKLNECWTKKDLNSLKSKLKKIDFSNINFRNNNPLSNLKKDLFIDLLLTKKYDPKSKDLKMLKIEGYSNKPLANGFEFVNPRNKFIYKFNKNFIKAQILNNIGILNAYYKMIQKFTPVTIMI